MSVLQELTHECVLFMSVLCGLVSLKVLYLIFTIVLLFWACFLPFWIWQLLGQFYPSLSLSIKAKRNINYLTTCLTYSNSCINPFLYTLLTKNYKEYLRKHKRSWTAGNYFNRRSRFQRSPRRSPSASSQQCTESFMLTHTASLRAHNSSLWGRRTFVITVWLCRGMIWVWQLWCTLKLLMYLWVAFIWSSRKKDIFLVFLPAR